MEQQIKRLNTYLKLPDPLFFHPPDKENTFIRLSDKGLFYCEENQELKCHFCEFRKKFEQENDLMTKHDCCRLNGDNTNVPISIKSDERVLAEFKKRYDLIERYRYYERCSEKEDDHPEPVVKTKLRPPCNDRGAKHINTSTVEKHSYPIPRVSRPSAEVCERNSTVTETSSGLLTNPPLQLYSSSTVKFYKRLQSAGFINLGDRAYCDTCHGEVRYSVWSLAVDQDPFAVHKQFYPRCPFIQKAYYEDGIPLGGRSVIHFS